ncbi:MULTISPECIES: polyketide cyclase [Pseudomonas]|uniref:polyketide cyclase n=1 Tax=Pseudomonas TaxID=286 RepID=UPI00056F72C7|nr:MULTISPECIES: polyketide cyclase [Pseudomonas]MBP2839341.1 nuclear transport factor 2 family protein [Pseudomonas sp. PNP]MCK2122740.1 nuclear transport factor 2 family protein [Pseudomonas sp. PNPG3]QUN65200.1 nuclear transport factor 2 family protein [Pseudomonas sp. JS425]
MSAITLPVPIAAYFVADTQGPDAVARCFTTQGVVKDKGQNHNGRDAIKAWNAESSTLYTCTTEPFLLERDGGIDTVHCHVVGNFPSSPIDLKFIFRLERGLIANMEITL